MEGGWGDAEGVGGGEKRLGLRSRLCCLILLLTITIEKIELRE